VYHGEQKFNWMYFTELWVISHGKDGKSHGKSWNFLWLKKYEPWNRIMFQLSAFVTIWVLDWTELILKGHDWTIE